MIPRHLIIGTVVLLIASLAMGFYVGSLRARVAKAEPPAPSGPQSLAPPPSGPTQQVTIYVAQDDEGVLRAQTVAIPFPSGRQQSAEQILQALLKLYLDPDSPHLLGAGSELRGVYLVDAAQSNNGSLPPGLAVIDVNGAFADGHRSGILVETLTVASLVKSLTANIEGIDRVKILVDGKERDTLAGHADLSNFLDASAWSQMAGDLANMP